MPYQPSLLECLEVVPEPRRRRGIRHRAAVVLAFAVAAVLAGADSVTAIIEWAQDAPPEVFQALDARTDRRGRRVPPSASTFRRVLRLLDATAVAAAFGTWLTCRVLAGLADADAIMIALDGKTVRGARTKDGKAPHLLAAMICGAQAVIAQKDVDAKTNEITQVAPLLDEIDITGALVTAGMKPVPCRCCPPRKAFPPRRAGVPDRADSPRPARRATPLRRRRPGHHQPKSSARRHARGHRRRSPQPLEIEARHRARQTLGRPEPAKAGRSLGSHITRMTKALATGPATLRCRLSKTNGSTSVPLRMIWSIWRSPRCQTCQTLTAGRVQLSPRTLRSLPAMSAR